MNNKLTFAFFAALLLCACTSERGRISSGTAFLVGDEGYVLTSYHVVKHCANYHVQGSALNTQAGLASYDEDNDLALLKVAGAAEGARLAREGSLRPWDQFIIIGYPGDAGRTHKSTVTNASLLSVHGPGGEPGMLQFSDSVAKGNSGGPLLDTSGNVVGIVKGKATIATQGGGTMWPVREVEHTDVAVSLPAIAGFLMQNRVSYAVGDSSYALPQAKIVNKASHFILNIQCVIQ